LPNKTMLVVNTLDMDTRLMAEKKKDLENLNVLKLCKFIM